MIRLPAAQWNYFNATDDKEKSSGLPERSTGAGNWFRTDSFYRRNLDG